MRASSFAVGQTLYCVPSLGEHYTATIVKVGKRYLYLDNGGSVNLLSMKMRQNGSESWLTSCYLSQRQYESHMAVKCEIRALVDALFRYNPSEYPGVTVDVVKEVRGMLGLPPRKAKGQ